MLENSPILTLFGVFQRNKGARQHPGKAELYTYNKVRARKKAKTFSAEKEDFSAEKETFSAEKETFSKKSSLKAWQAANFSVTLHSEKSLRQEEKSLRQAEKSNR